MTDTDAQGIGYQALVGLDACGDCQCPIAPGLYRCPHCDSSRLATTEEHGRARLDVARAVDAAMAAWHRDERDHAIRLCASISGTPMPKGISPSTTQTVGASGTNGALPSSTSLARCSLAIQHRALGQYVSRRLDETAFQEECEHEWPVWSLVVFHPEKDFNHAYGAIPAEARTRIIIERSDRTRELWQDWQPKDVAALREMAQEMYPGRPVWCLI